MTNQTFRSHVHDIRPDVVATNSSNDVKRKLALALRALRKAKDLTQKDVEERSNLSQPVVSRLESPTGPLPNWDTILQYVSACGGHMLVGFSEQSVDEEAFMKSREDAKEVMISAVAV